MSAPQNRREGEGGNPPDIISKAEEIAKKATQGLDLIEACVFLSLPREDLVEITGLMSKIVDKDPTAVYTAQTLNKIANAIEQQHEEEKVQLEMTGLDMATIINVVSAIGKVPKLERRTYVPTTWIDENGGLSGDNAYLRTLHAFIKAANESGKVNLDLDSS